MTEAGEPGGRVVVDETVAVMLAPVGPVAPTGPAGPVAPVGPTTVILCGTQGLQLQFLSKKLNMKTSL